MEICDNSISNPLVSVRCFTYNQSAYIKDALNGFVMQQTNFPFVVLVVDDASTDGEQEVIRKFMTEEFELSDASVAYEKETEFAYIQYAQHKTNKNCFMVAMFLKENHYSQKKKKFPYLAEWRDGVKYEAICEGDDYWIDPLKLQKQVDFLEENDECGLVYGKAKEYLQAKGMCGSFIGGKATSFEDIFFKGNPVPTLTACYRVKILNEYRKNIQLPNFAMGDLPMWLYISKHYSIHFIDEVLGVYRVLKNSASGRISYDARLRFIQSSFDVRRFFCDYYKLPYMNSLDEFKARVYYLSAKEFGQIEDMRKHYVCIKNKLSIKERVVHYLYILGIVGNKG
ncbi:MAG: hypothetical protein U0L67_02920 [Paludibacteraceae bacterium]|jgi:glycosyltransferase involved in cell wall biosynthesis|nr:hypothetical protein [Paludibacteraceae bacterium]MEE0911383.1 hypothetical protein [Paludibacteraceae bacterium]